MADGTARGGDDVWAEVRRRRINEDDRVPMEMFGDAAAAPPSAQSYITAPSPEHAGRWPASFLRRSRRSYFFPASFLAQNSATHWMTGAQSAAYAAMPP